MPVLFDNGVEKKPGRHTVHNGSRRFYRVGCILLAGKEDSSQAELSIEHQTSAGPGNFRCSMFKKIPNTGNPSMLSNKLEIKKPFNTDRL
jgi:hypothetical protein